MTNWYLWPQPTWLSTICLLLLRICGLKQNTGDLGWTRTHGLLLTSAEVLFCRCLPGNNRPARCLYSSGFPSVLKLMEILHKKTSQPAHAFAVRLLWKMINLFSLPPFQSEVWTSQYATTKMFFLCLAFANWIFGWISRNIILQHMF